MSTDLGLTTAIAELVLFLGACGVLLIATVKLPEKYLMPITQAVLVITLIIVFITWPKEASTSFHELYEVSGLTAILQAGVLLSCVGVLAYSGRYLRDRFILNGEYLSLALFATLGMMFLVAANNFLTIYLGLELMSLCLYAMIAIRRENDRAIEAAMKYFVLGALASGFLLYGMSMIYAATSTLNLPEIASIISEDSAETKLLLIGVVFMIAGVAFKLGAAPFHMWLPDVYDGAPTAVTLFIGSAPKIAALAMAIKLFTVALAPLLKDWAILFAILAIASLGIGNVIAIAQSSLKRMLAYSTISHMGFLISGIVAGTPEGYAAALFYAFAYAIMTIAGFGLLVVMSRGNDETELLSDLNGLATRNPLAAGLMMIVMLSMAGIPPLVGFYAKFAVWTAVVDAGWTWLAVVSGVFAVIGAFYYLRVIKIMYFDEASKNDKEIKVDNLYLIIAGINGLIIIVLGLFPNSLLSACIEVFS